VRVRKLKRIADGAARRLREYSRLAGRGPRYGALLLRVRRERLIYLELAALLDLAHRVQELERRRLPGGVIETGCALGGSAIVLAAGKKRTRPLYVYDVFGMIPPPSEVDGEDIVNRYSEIESGRAKGLGGDDYYGYQENLLDRVKQTFERLHVPPTENSVHFIRGEFTETLDLDEPIALAHIDCDWYESVKTCL
jgi:O-methyltransferase